MLIFQRHSIDNDISTSHSYSYTIVELLVVIVVISVLAAIIITSYVGITERARIATIQADLKNASKQLEIFKTNNSNEDHPSTIDCSSPESSTNTCVRSNSGNSFSYTPYNSASPKSYRLTVTNGSLAYYITTGGSIALVTPLTLTTPTVSGITATAATLGANITGDGGDNMTAYGICWGTTPNPTTNCSEIEQGALTAMSPATVAANTPVKIAVSGDGKSVYAQDSTMITMFSRDTTTGVLTPLSPATINTGDSSAHGLEVTPDGKFVYAYAKNSSNAAYIYMYSRDINTGKLTALSPSTYNAPMYPEGMTMSPDGNYIYALGNNTVYKLTRNTTTGLITSSTQTTVNGQGEIVISPDGLYLYVLGLDAYSKAQISMFSRNISTGALSSLTPSTYNLGSIPFYGEL